MEKSFGIEKPAIRTVCHESRRQQPSRDEVITALVSGGFIRQIASSDKMRSPFSTVHICGQRWPLIEYSLLCAINSPGHSYVRFSLCIAYAFGVQLL